MNAKRNMSAHDGAGGTTDVLGLTDAQLHPIAEKIAMGVPVRDAFAFIKRLGGEI